MPKRSSMALYMYLQQYIKYVTMIKFQVK